MKPAPPVTSRWRMVIPSWGVVTRLSWLRYSVFMRGRVMPVCP